MKAPNHFQIEDEDLQNRNYTVQEQDRILQQQKPQDKKIMFLYVKDDITFWNLLGMALVLPTMLQIICYLDVAFVYLIQNENYFNIPNDEASIISGDIIFYIHIICLIFDCTSGYLHDLIGRRKTIFFGFLFASIAMAIQPWLSTVYPGLFLARLVIAIGLSAPASSPLVADYVKMRSRGLASAYIGLFAGIGVLTGLFVIFGFTKDLDYKTSFTISAAFTLSLATFLFFTIKDGKIEKKGQQDLPMMVRFQTKSREVWHEMKTKLPIPISMIGGVMCRMLNLVATLHLNLFISHFYDRSNEGQEMAKTIATKVNGMSMTLAIFSSFFVGYIADKIPSSNVLLYTFGLSTFGFALFTQIIHPNSTILYISTICIQVGGQCQQIAVIQLLNKNLEKGTRGAVFGLYVAVTSIGLLVISKVGGFLFEKVSIYAPFVLVGIAELAYFCLIAFLKITHKFN